ncbi:AhpC/TSA family protein [Anaerovirgula multivorans]|uniref:AhpC/TSA family protein n=1 Tax=Anaerovirgula multivorans TaxID=312168 RepID=A0A239EMK1_9FIRM|nr:TlpA disulfide reductase family protein [Anaerovirgula multivorans]SNS45498.1 AhpC/TSA family protein [Anaerovirgula multivorans]
MKAINKRLISLLLLGLVILLLVGCGRKAQDITEDTDPIQQEENLQQEPDSGEVDGDLWEEAREKDSLEDILKGEDKKPAILSFWVSWNEESKEQLDILENVYKLLEEDVVIIGIHATSFDTMAKEEIQSYMREKKYSFPILLDEEGEKTQSYFVGSLPTTVFLDEKEETVKSFTTLIKEDEVLDEIEQILEPLIQ